jgi:radical SAM protein with 4Fe4S-binding SPASM domain
MSMPLFRKIVDEAATIGLIHEVCVTGLGEPTLDPHLVDRIQYIRSTVKRDVFITMFTNGVYLSPQMFDKLMAAGLSFVAVSLNAVTPEQHEAVMGLKDKYTDVCANINYAIQNRGMGRVEVRAVATGWTRGQIVKFGERWGAAQHGGFGQLIHEGNWAGDNRTTHRAFKPSDACSRALGQIYVTWDGKVTTCCFDPAGTQVFGDLNKQTIREVYASPAYVAFREAHFADRADTYEICKNCTRI